MIKFKNGSRVKFITKNDWNIPYGSKGTVLSTQHDEVHVEFDTSFSGRLDWFTGLNELKLIPKRKKNKNK